MHANACLCQAKQQPLHLSLGQVLPGVLIYRAIGQAVISDQTHDILRNGACIKVQSMS